MKKFIFIILISFSLYSCEEVIKLDLTEGQTQIVIDAFLNNFDTTQNIILTKTTPYFYTGTIPPVNGATISVTNVTQNRKLDFIENNNTGIYQWTPQNNLVIGVPKDSFYLKIEFEGNTYSASFVMTRTIIPDSITFFKPPSPIIGTGRNNNNDLNQEVWARDIKGELNFYWIKSFTKETNNDIFLFNNKKINTIQNANPNDESSLGYPTDGSTIFQQARRDLTNNIKVNTMVRVEIHSIDANTFTLFRQINSTGGGNPLFSPVAANLPTNIINNNSKLLPVGWFAVSEASFLQGVRDELGSTIKYK